MWTLSAGDLRTRLETILQPDQIFDRPIDRIARASDASFYRLIPQAVLRPRSIADVQQIYRFSQRERIPITFRTAGTSLSGQAVTDGLLVDVAYHFRDVQALDEGRRVRVEPGVIGGFVNLVLKPFGRKIGPDPASINACMMGGILNNNSSGMCCGVSQNSYQTLDSLTFVLPSGTVVDTAAPDADERFRALEPGIASGLLELRQRVIANAELTSRIRYKYSMKNTVGYSLNAFLDFERPVDLMRHLLIGSEGTLAFIAEAVLHTVPDLPYKYTGLLLFPTIRDACAAIVPLGAAGAAALELMDRPSLRSVEDQPGVSPSLRALGPDATGLLVEFQEAADDRAGIERRARAAVGGLVLCEPARFTHDAAEQADLWRIRRGMIPSVGAMRERGTTLLIEDVVFPVPALADAVVDLSAIFRKHRYDEAIIFGHAKDGNLHFIITQGFADQAAVDRYEHMMDDVVELVVKRYDGALKAEHGTGRNMAPFVETEWGPEAYDIMKRLKALVDPHGLLNPGVILNTDPRAHVSDLKRMPIVEDEVDKCIECGFCESHCPSRDLSTTPRQRIVVRREMQRLTDAGEANGRLGALRADFQYEVLDTCATDGLCALACPVAIDTGQLTKRFRAAGHSAGARRLAGWTARHFAATERLARGALGAGHLARRAIGSRAVAALARAMRAVAGDQVPQWIEPMPRLAPRRLPDTPADTAAAVYFPSCLSRTMGALPGEPDALSLPEAFVTVAARAGVPLHIPADVRGHCCGQPFSSKGFVEAHTVAINATVERLWTWSNQGARPVVVDTSPCTYNLRTGHDLTAENRARLKAMCLLDGVEFFADTVLPRLKVAPLADAVALHPVCSLLKMGLSPKLTAIAKACSTKVTVPLSAGCCGFAGDRGWLVPELTAAATRLEAAEAHDAASAGHFSSSRTCEIGLTRSTGAIYRSFVFLLERASR